MTFKRIVPFLGDKTLSVCQSDPYQCLRMTKAASSALDAVEHYKKKLTRHIDDPDPSVMLHCLAKLDRVPMTFDILQVRTKAMHCL